MSPGFILPDDDDVFAPVASAPTADATPAPAAAPAGPAATVLVVGTQAAAADGSYQSLITLLSDEGKVGVEKQMVDRIVDGATTFLPSQFTLISLLLPPTLITSTLVSLLEPALAPGGALQIRGDAAESGDVAGELRMVGLAGTTTDGVLTATKPKSSSAPLSLKRPASSIDTSSLPSTSTSTTAQSLPLRTSRAAKASLWAFTAAPSGTSTPTIDESTLLTEADLERPTLVKREDCDVKRTRKACKNCSCGLRELLLDEAEKDDLVAAGFGEKKSTGAGEKAGVRKIKSSNVTSSCGSCYLGDAFRCASCPYLGMPAFEPGQAIKIDASMDDI